MYFIPEVSGILVAFRDASMTCGATSQGSGGSFKVPTK